MLQALRVNRELVGDVPDRGEPGALWARIAPAIFLEKLHVSTGNLRCASAGRCRDRLLGDPDGLDQAALVAAMVAVEGRHDLIEEPVGRILAVQDLDRLEVLDAGRLAA